MGRLTLAIIIGGAALLLTGAWKLWFAPIADVNYRVHATVAAYGKTYTGEGVRNLVVEKHSTEAGTAIGMHVRGEAIRIPIDNRPALYLLLDENNSWPLHHGTPTQPIVCLAKADSVSELGSFNDCSANFTPEMATFDDELSPATGRFVNYTVGAPDGRCQWICLLDVRLERTSDPVSTGITKYLPWLSRGNPWSEAGHEPGDGSMRPNKLYNGYFSTEVAGAR